MTADVLFNSSFPHGTPGGFNQGCHGAHCPAPIPCRDVHRRYAGDFTFRRLFNAGVSLTEILEQEQQAVRDARRAERRAAATNTRRRGSKRSQGQLGIDRSPSTELQHAVYRHHSEGLTDAQIGARIGKTRDQVRSTRRWMNLPINPETSAKDRVKEMHARGMNDVQIAEALHCERSYVATLRRKAGLPLIRIPRSTIKSEDIVRLHGEGLTDMQIAERLGCDRVTIQKRRNNMHLPVNKAPAQSGLSHSVSEAA